MRIRTLLLVLCFLSPSPLFAEVPITITAITADDVQGLREQIDLANTLPGLRQVNISPGANGNTVMRFPDLPPGTLTALPVLTGRIAIRGLCEPRCTLTPADGMNFPLLDLEGNAFLELNRIEVLRFSREGDGGAIYGRDSARGVVKYSRFVDNYASGYGGGFSMKGNSSLKLRASYFRGNQAGIFGDDIDITSAPPDGPALDARGNQFRNLTGTVSLENPFGRIVYFDNTSEQAVNGIDSTDTVELRGDIFTFPRPMMSVQSNGNPGPKPEALCNDFGSGAFNSLGYNISADASCSLDQETDLPSTDPMLAENADGLLVPQPGSPAIDSGLIDVVLPGGGGLASLPCGYKDVGGTARPQDASGDGIFECDRGAVEVAGGGEVVAGHSSVFYNPDRNGEGNYVEILDGGKAIVYTFTYNPDGTGPAWFLGLGDVSGNSIILDDLSRPTGTPFGDDFDPAEIEFTPIGSMSMVFPDCQASAPGGNIAYTGEPDLGYEALISRATRLAHITGCGPETPSPNAGLSGSFYDPARNGEGLIVEWLSNGDVLAVFFTYDTEGNQFWLSGQAAATGKTVTMTAVYPSAFTPWGHLYNPDDVTIDPWGTFTLTWTDCNTMSFEYSSSVGSFGSATRNYTRLSTLAGTNCPAFP